MEGFDIKTQEEIWRRANPRLKPFEAAEPETPATPGPLPPCARIPRRVSPPRQNHISPLLVILLLLGAAAKR